MRVILLGDYHAGSVAGLTPRPTNAIQRGVLARYQDCIKTLGPRPDYLVANGDLVDGQQLRGRDAGDSDWLETQMRDACQLLKMWQAREIFIVSGTQYHVSAGTLDMEHVVASMLREGGTKAHFSRKLNLTLRGWFILQARHHIGSSGVPHGRFTSQNRSRVWGVLNAALDSKSWPHLSVYSHVHYWTYSEDAWGAVMTLPAWQAVGSRYGSERCDGHCDIGAVELRVGKTQQEGWQWRKRLYQASVADRAVRR